MAMAGRIEPLPLTFFSGHVGRVPAARRLVVRLGPGPHHAQVLDRHRAPAGAGFSFFWGARAPFGALPTANCRQTVVVRCGNGGPADDSGSDRSWHPYMVMACIVMVYVVMAYIAMLCIAMPYVVMARVVMARGWIGPASLSACAAGMPRGLYTCLSTWLPIPAYASMRFLQAHPHCGRFPNKKPGRLFFKYLGARRRRTAERLVRL